MYTAITNFGLIVHKSHALSNVACMPQLLTLYLINVFCSQWNIFYISLQPSVNTSDKYLKDKAYVLNNNLNANTLLGHTSWG